MCILSTGIWKSYKPNVSYFRVWGCLTFLRLPDPKRPKRGVKASRYAFMGYAFMSKAYKFLDLDKNIMIESLNILFYENVFLFNTKNS